MEMLASSGRSRSRSPHSVDQGGGDGLDVDGGSAEAEATIKEGDVKVAREGETPVAKTKENSAGYFEPPVGYVFKGAESEYTRIDMKHLGVGVFSVVWATVDKRSKLMALKVVRKVEHLQKVAEKEVTILQKLRDLAGKDEDGSSNICMLCEHFVHDGYLCLVFPKLQGSLRSAGKQPLERVVAFSRQLLLALRFLHNSVGLVHGDVKPDNLLLRHDGLAVLLSDFGSAKSWLELQEIDDLQPLFYRAPEVIIGMMLGPPIDMWSVGCTMYELATGQILFGSCTSPRDVIRRTMELRGAISERMREQGRSTKLYFGVEGFLSDAGHPVGLSAFKPMSLLPDLAEHVDFGVSKGLSKQEQAQMQLSKLIGGIAMVGAAQRQAGGARKTVGSEAQLHLLASLIEACLETEPASRISAAKAAGQQIFDSVKPPPAMELEDGPAVVSTNEGDAMM